MNNTETQLIMAMTGAGENDIKKLIQVTEDWELDISSITKEVIVEDKCPTINALFFEAYRLHANDILDSISDIAEDLEDTEDTIFFDKDKLDSYVVEIDANGVASGYVSSYDFWQTDDIHMLISESLDEVFEFLVTENIVMVDDPCENLKEIYGVDIKECSEEAAAIELLKRTYQKINNDGIVECPTDCI